LPFAGPSAITRPPVARLKGCRGGGAVLRLLIRSNPLKQLKLP
jgi:hypothetical protein